MCSPVISCSSQRLCPRFVIVGHGYDIRSAVEVLIVAIGSPPPTPSMPSPLPSPPPYILLNKHGNCAVAHESVLF